MFNTGKAITLVCCALIASTPSMANTKPTNLTDFDVTRLPNNPLLAVTDHVPDLAENINGPSVIQVPDWVVAPLGRYYLYFSHHQGDYIRMAYADHPTGPFTVHPGGVLPLSASGFPVEPPTADQLSSGALHTVEAGKPIPFYAHIASPDVIVVPESREIRMYYHGLESDGRQYTRVAISQDGLHFTAQPELLGQPYFRVFRFDNVWYALAMPGVIYRSANGLTGFELGPALFNPTMRHSALLRKNTTLHVFYTQAGDAPEAILHATIDLSRPWLAWQESSPLELLRAREDWEGGDLPIKASARGAIKKRVNQLRDPAIFQTGGRTYLYYSIAGESGIGVAELKFRSE